MWEYRIAEGGLIIGEPLRGFGRLTGGIPGPWYPEIRENSEVRQDRSLRSPSETEKGPND
jgi:hypothetical protein